MRRNAKLAQRRYAELAQRRYAEKEAERQAAQAAFEPELAAMPPAEAELVRLMKSHDWWYDYSDDGRVSRNGRDHWEKIRAAIASLPKDAASRLWSRFAPPQFRDAQPASPCQEKRSPGNRQRPALFL